ncbi:hypothetical protein U1Q18_034975 [Sarracenia purpurea var. burkii]
MFHKTLLVPCLFFFIGVASSHSEVASCNSDVEVFFQFFFKVYKNGTVEKLDKAVPRVPASLDPETGVQSKDTQVGARLYAPKDSINASAPKAPLVIYFHGGGFSTSSAASQNVHIFVNSLAARANVFALSVDYRLAPEHPLPAAYEDVWDVLRWVAKHACVGGVTGGMEPWLNEKVDFSRVYLAGDSAGANIAHNLAMRVGLENFHRVNINGIVLIHPYFLLEQPTASLLAVNEQMRNNITKLWSYVCPSGNGSRDTRVNPTLDPLLPMLGSERVLVCLAGEDPLIDAGKNYGEALRWRGGKTVEMFVSRGRHHVFHLRQPNTKEAAEMLDRVASFLNLRSVESTINAAKDDLCSAINSVY